MRKSLLLVALAILLVLPSQSFVNAKEADSMDEKPVIIQQTDNIIKMSTSKDGMILNLENQGWELVSTSEEPEIQPLTTGGDATITYTIMNQSSSHDPTLYLIHAKWQIGGSWDSGSEKVPDAFTLGVVNQNNQAVNAVPEYAQVYAGTSARDLYDNPRRSWVERYTGSATSFVIQDGPSNILQYYYKFGSYGEAWFYFTSTPTNGTSYYAVSQLTHTWSTDAISLDSIEVSYPWAVKVKYTTTTNLQQWTKAGNNHKFSF